MNKQTQMNVISLYNKTYSIPLKINKNTDILCQEHIIRTSFVIFMGYCETNSTLNIIHKYTGHQT